MAHFTQCTEEITGGLQTWHGRHGDVSANNRMQIWPPNPPADGDGRGEGTNGETCHSARSKWYLTAARRDYRKRRHPKLLSPQALQSEGTVVAACHRLWHMLDFWSAMSCCILATHWPLCKRDRPGLSAMTPRSHMSHRAAAPTLGIIQDPSTRESL